MFEITAAFVGSIVWSLFVLTCVRIVDVIRDYRRRRAEMQRWENMLRPLEASARALEERYNLRPKA